MESRGRWAGRNNQKDDLRHSVWAELEQQGAAIGSPWSSIPNFHGAEFAANQLCQLEAWQNAKIVKSNPDSAQAWVRLNALQQNKIVYTPVPELVADFPLLCLDPQTLRSQGVAFEDVMYSEGAMAYGERVNFDQIPLLDFVVVGCVAVTQKGGRTGKGAGFADLELGIFRHFGSVKEDTPVVTTVHDIQVVADDNIVMQEHDTPLNWIATPDRLIASEAGYRQPGPINWDCVRDDQFETIPFLKSLKDSIS